MSNSNAIIDEFRQQREPVSGKMSRDWSAAIGQFRALLNSLVRRTPEREFTDADVDLANAYLRDRVLKADKNLTRRNSTEIGWAHSERVAENAYNFARFVYGNNKSKLNRVKILALLHDTVEDFGGSLKEIEMMFGAGMARSVALVTTPKPQELAIKYQDETAKFLPGEKVATYTTETMDVGLKQLKQDDHDQYKRLKFNLTRQHKMDTMPNYGLDETLVKIADNGDSPQSDAKDIAAKRIRVGVNRGHALAAEPQRPDDKPVKFWSLEKVRQKAESRTEFHGALIKRLGIIWGESKRLGYPGLLKVPNFPDLIAQANQFFESKIMNLEYVTGAPLRTPQPMPS